MLLVLRKNVFPFPDEAYVTMGNFAKTPFYARVGREYLRYGHYERNVLPATFTQLLTQTHADAIEIGFVDWHGFNGSVATFRSFPRPPAVGPFGGPAGIPRNVHVNNVAVQLGYDYQNGPFSAEMSVDWLLDMSSVNFIGTPNANHVGLGVPSSGRRRSAIAATIKANWNAFDMMAQYTSSINRFNPANMNFNVGPFIGLGTGARPTAWMIALGYTFTMMNNNDSHVGINYQMTHNALALGLPRYRVQGDATVDVWKNTSVGVTLVYDKDYGVTSAGTLNAAGAFGVANMFTGSNRSNFTGLLGVNARFA